MVIALTNQQFSRLPYLLALVCFIKLLSTLYANASFYHTTTRIAAQELAAATEKSNSPDAQITDADVDKLLMSQWAGIEPQSHSTVQDAPAPIQYELKGIFMDMSQNESYAVILEKGGREKSYLLNDHLSDGSVITAIFPEYIILQTAQGERKLTLRNSF